MNHPWSAFMNRLNLVQSFLCDYNRICSSHNVISRGISLIKIPLTRHFLHQVKYLVSKEGSILLLKKAYLESVFKIKIL